MIPENEPETDTSAETPDAAAPAPQTISITTAADIEANISIETLDNGDLVLRFPLSLVADRLPDQHRDTEFLVAGVSAAAVASIGNAAITFAKAHIAREVSALINL